MLLLQVLSKQHDSSTSWKTMIDARCIPVCEAYVYCCAAEVAAAAAAAAAVAAPSDCQGWHWLSQ
jgi:hypothetical protein